MKKRMLALALLVALVLPVLAACGGPITQAKAEQIALEDLQVTADEATCHTHVSTVDGQSCYTIYVTVGTQSYEYVVNGSGEILSSGISTGHSH